MDVLGQWVQSIVIYLLLISFVYQVFPDSEYKKYMKVCTGLILMIVTIWPIVKWSGNSDTLTFFLDLETTKIDARDFEVISQAVESEKNNAVTRAYKTQLEQKIYALFEESDLYPVAADIEIVEDVKDVYYGSVQSVCVTVGIDENKEKTNVSSGAEIQTAVTPVEKVKIEEIIIDEQPVSEDFTVSEVQTEQMEVIRRKIAEALYMDAQNVKIKFYHMGSS